MTDSVMGGLLVLSYAAAFCSLLVWLFRRPKNKTEPEPYVRVPIAGEVWVFRGDGSPFPAATQAKAMVREVRDGWVRYSLGGMFPNNRLSIASFTHCYKPVKDQAMPWRDEEAIMKKPELTYIIVRYDDARAALTPEEQREMDRLCNKISRYRMDKEKPPITGMVYELRPPQPQMAGGQ